jgi:dGTPase
LSDDVVRAAVRLRLEQWEERNLAPGAQRSAATRGRARPEPECATRTAYQRDRDRIVHSKAFRRLKHKTQVFIAPAGDHYRTRLTHTLEVAQVARGVARALALNEDLAETVALGHDLGHTPFGHLGEDVLDACLRALPAGQGAAPVRASAACCPGAASSGAELGFHHAAQSLRVVDLLEGEGGLNLTWEVRDGIRQHSGDGRPATLEGQLVQIADRIAYLNHDIDDALRAGILAAADIPAGVLEVLGDRHSERINTMVEDLVRQGLPEAGGRMAFGPAVAGAADELERFMFEQVYLGRHTSSQREKAARLLRLLFGFYLKHPEHLEGGCAGGDIPRAVADYVAGMTDRYAIEQFTEHFVPSAWRPS